MERLLKILFVIGLVLYFLFMVVARAPAQWGAWAAIQAAPNLALTGVSGTLWQGRAATAQVRVGNEALDLGALSWKLNPWALLAAKLCLDVDSERVRGYVCRTPSGKNTVRQLLADQLPMQLLNAQLGIQLGGTGSITLAEGRFDDQGRIEQLQGNITWQQARVNVGTGWFALGSYAADISENDNGGVAANITDIEGNFTVQLQGEMTPGEEPRVHGLITPKEGAQQPLVDALSVFTETLDDGSFRVAWPMGS